VRTRRNAADLLYGWLVRRLPGQLRAQAEEMEELFRWQLARSSGRRQRFRFVAGALVDAVRQSIESRRRDQRLMGRERRARRVEAVTRDLRIAFRNLVRQPGFTLPVVTTLALGIGMAAAMAVVVQRVLLDALPFPDGDRLVVIRERTESGVLLPASYANFEDWREGSRSFAAMSAVYGPQNVIVLGAAQPVRVPALFVSQDYFRVSGVEPERGRVLVAGENAPGGVPAVVVSHRFWLESLGGVEDLSGVTLSLQDLLNRVEAYAVVGVMPAGFELMGEADIYVPLDRGVPWSVRGNHVVHVIGRMAAGGSAESAARDLDRVQAGVRAQVGDETEAVGVGVTTLRDETVGSVRTPVILLLIGSLLLLATSFLNVSGALLARGVARQKEIQVRASLGATRGRLLSGMVLESVLYAGIACLAGVVIARVLLGVLSAAAPVQIPNLVGITSAWTQILSAAAALTFVGLPLFGVATAAASTRGDGGLLRVRSASGTRGARNVGRALIAVETALALMLLTTAGVLGRSLWGIVTADTGFEPAGVLTAEVNLPPRPDGTAAMIVRYFENGLAELRATPGVESAGMSNLLPIGGASSIAGPVQLESGEAPEIIAHYRVADTGYFETMSIPLVRGRLFDHQDVPGAPHAAVINTTMARILFGEEDPIGRRFHLGGMDPYRDDWLTIVGIVDEARPWSAAPGTYPVYYVHYRQRPAFLLYSGADFVARVRTSDVAPALRDRLAGIESDVPVRIRSLDDRLASPTADRRFVLTLLALFALLALALTAVGIWGVVSFISSRRTRDIGIRLALGATPSAVLRGLQWETGPPVLIGMLFGAVFATSLTRLVRSQLFGVGIFDPLSLAAVAVTIAGTAWAASYLPARRAKRLDPVITLRDA
jgi:putative ABC transport system permease protein